MDENEIQIPEEELPEFTLEDILREFGSQNDDGKVHDYPGPELMEDLPQRELMEDAPISDPLPLREEPELLIWKPAEKNAEPAADLDQTRSFAPVATASAGSDGDTIRVDAAPVRPPECSCSL